MARRSIMEPAPPARLNAFSDALATPWLPSRSTRSSSVVLEGGLPGEACVSAALCKFLELPLKLMRQVDVPIQRTLDTVRDMADHFLTTEAILPIGPRPYRRPISAIAPQSLLLGKAALAPAFEHMDRCTGNLLGDTQAPEQFQRFSF